MEGGRYSHEIDLFKGILVSLMVLAHCIQFFGIESGVFRGITSYINLTTFSGFIFSFGYVSQKAYYNKQLRDVWQRMARNCCKILIAFYISSFSFFILVEHETYSMAFLKRVFLIHTYAGWSEFLVSFVAILLLGIVLFHVFKHMNNKILLGIAILSFIICYLPYEKVTHPIIALFIGSSHYITFPVIQFLIYYALGVMVSKTSRSKGFKLLVIMSVLSLPICIYRIIIGEMPSRFPPDWRYVFGAMFVVALYYVFAEWIAQKTQFRGIGRRVRDCLEGIGRESLYFLLVSNIIIFALAGVGFVQRHNVSALILYAIIMCMLWYIKSLIGVKKMK